MSQLLDSFWRATRPLSFTRYSLAALQQLRAGPAVERLPAEPPPQPLTLN